MNLLSMMYSYQYLQHLHQLNSAFKFHNNIHIFLSIFLFLVFCILSFNVFAKYYKYSHEHPNLSQHDKKKIIHKSKFIRGLINLGAILSVVFFIFANYGTFNHEYSVIGHDYHVARANHRVHEDNLKLSVYNHRYHYYKKLNQNDTCNANQATKYNHKYNSTYNYEHEHVYEGSFGRQNIPYYRPSDISVAKHAGKMQRIPHSIFYDFTSHHII